MPTKIVRCDLIGIHKNENRGVIQTADMLRFFSQLWNNFIIMLNEGRGENPIHGTVVRYDCKRKYLDKQHYCYECGKILEKKKREVIVNSESEEAKNYDFHFVDSYLCGNIRFISFYFECPECGKVYEIRDYLNLEKMYKKKMRKEKLERLFKNTGGSKDL